ncbi:hypothetical protein ACPPVO_55295 [Dactylosporangium sp. McL0621]|uniref:hypothetical protein n=1 Tax=Dactylosporangium sp. McL0621 TaxID=3415678 RepID=UPI003CF31B2A
MTPVRVRPHLAEILERTQHVVVTFSVLGNLLPEPEAVARLVGEMLEETGRRASVLQGVSDNPFDMLAEAYEVSEEVGRRAEQLIHDAEVDAADWVPVTAKSAELLEACRATGRSVAVYAPHSESAVGRYLHRLGLRSLVGPALGRGFAMRNRRSGRWRRCSRCVTGGPDAGAGVRGDRGPRAGHGGGVRDVLGDVGHAAGGGACDRGGADS